MGNTCRVPMLNSRSPRDRVLNFTTAHRAYRSVRSSRKCLADLRQRKCTDDPGRTLGQAVTAGLCTLNSRCWPWRRSTLTAMLVAPSLRSRSRSSSRCGCPGRYKEWDHGMALTLEEVDQRVRSCVRQNFHFVSKQEFEASATSAPPSGGPGSNPPDAPSTGTAGRSSAAAARYHPSSAGRRRTGPPPDAGPSLQYTAAGSDSVTSGK